MMGLKFVRCGLLLTPMVSVLLVNSAKAQTSVGGSFGGVGMSVHMVQETPLGTQDLTGLLFGGEATMQLWQSQISIRYLKGSVALTPGGPSQNLTETEITIGSMPAGWLTLKAGPHMRSYTTAAGTESSLLWEGRVQLHTKVVAPTLRSYVEGWRTFSGGISIAAPLGEGQGVEGGLILHLPNAHLLARLGYRVDRSTIPESGLVNTVEALFLALSFGR